LQEDDPKAFEKVMKSVRRYWEKDSVYSKNGEPKAEEGGHTEDQHGLPSVFNYENYRKVREQGGFPPREVVGHALIKGLSINIFGEAGLGKSWFLAHLAHVFLQRGERVIFLDFENGHQTLFERMEALKVPDRLLDNFYPLRPEGDWGKAWAEFVSEVRPGLVGTDGLIGLLDSLGLSENDSQDIEKVKGQIFRPALDVGSTFLTLDHPGNEDKYRERGSSRKGQLFDARWKIANPGPRINRLAPVECKLILEKDRTSSLPIKVKDALTYRVGGNPFVVDLMTVISPGGLHQTERKVYEHIRKKGNSGDRFARIVEDLKLSESTVDRWIKKLEDRDLIRKADDGTWHVTPERVDRVSIPDPTTSSYEAKLDSPRRFHVLFAYREMRESTISAIHEYLNPPTMPEENISRDEVRDITLTLLDMGELRESGERGGHTLYAPTSTLEDLEEDEEPFDW
jgi:DNA-binding transcriptional ArsR family regulator